MFNKSFMKMMVCDMAGTIIQEKSIVYKTLYKTIKMIEPNITEKDIYDYLGWANKAPCERD